MKNINTAPVISDIKMIVILRGVSGSGKTTLSEGIENLLYTLYEKMGFEDSFDENTYRVCSNDHYFETKDGYKFNADKLPEAFDHCKAEFDDAIGEGANVIVIDNTNMIPRHYEYYIEEGKFFDYKIVQVCLHTEEICKDVAETFFNRNIHNVPIHSLINQLKQYHKDASVERFGVADIIGFFREKLSAIKSHNVSFDRAMRHQANIVRKLEEEEDNISIAIEKERNDSIYAF